MYNYSLKINSNYRNNLRALPTKLVKILLQPVPQKVPLIYIHREQNNFDEYNLKV